MTNKPNIENFILNTKNTLLSEMNPSGYWEGELSSSALATAIAIFTLNLVDKNKYKNKIDLALQWLADNINDDGGFGDTTDSKSNLSTTLLSWCALSTSNKYHSIEEKTSLWLINQIGDLEPANIAKTVHKYYGNDKTFSAPILSMCAIAGKLGDIQNGLSFIPQFPFEIAQIPHRFFKWLNLPVVSYAIPALIAIGLLKHTYQSKKFSIMKNFRNLSKKRILNILEKIQPDNGGFLEAVPLTGFTVMCLTFCKIKNKTTENGTDFILNSIRNDGGVPIDTNLSTWVTSLSYIALNQNDISESMRKNAIKYLSDLQLKNKHFFNHSEPSGWSWTYLSGGVPDADDTASALIALKKLTNNNSANIAAKNGIKWLINLQNKDGGIPTFCKGWGKLPFDKSTSDITANMLLAFSMWYDIMPNDFQLKMKKTMKNAINFLRTSQNKNGSFIPLWFGNQNIKNYENPVYGTSRVLIALQQIKIEDFNLNDLIQSSLNFLRTSQNKDGGFGGNINIISTIEETSLAINALALTKDTEIINKALKWLAKETENGTKFTATPIGLYFASLWYSEKLYPIIFTLSALNSYK